MTATVRPQATEGARLGRLLLGAAAVVLVVLLAKGALERAPAGPAAGAPAPGFALPLLGGPEDATVSKGDLAGRTAVINVWASWCPPCREEAPALRRAHERASPELVAFLGIVHRDVESDARDFVERFGLLYPHAVDDGSFDRAYGVRGVPMTFVVDPSGRLAATHFGPISESRLAVLIEEARAGAGAAP